jgi:uncharacterized protein
MGPLLTLKLVERLLLARRNRVQIMTCSVDLERTTTTVAVGPDEWSWNGRRFPYPTRAKDRTVYHWVDGDFSPVARYASSLVKLVPTDWGPPTFEIDGIKMLPTAQVSPYADAERKVQLVQPRGKVVLDTCGGLGYFAAWCMQAGAAHVWSYEKNQDVIWLRSLNPWSPTAEGSLTLRHADIVAAVGALASNSIEAVLHDPPRFGIAGELYSQSFYAELARVMKRKARLFHYTGSPNKLTTGRDVPREVANRLRTAGFTVEKSGDGVLAIKS